MAGMDMTGWITGQLFLQTVDDDEVKQVSDFLNARGIGFQVLTLSERMALGEATRRPRPVGQLRAIQHRDPAGRLPASRRTGADRTHPALARRGLAQPRPADQPEQ